MDGLLNVNKPAGITSFGVVARVRRLTGERRVGHAGTLDPDATGVLPVCLGKGTRTVQYLNRSSKTYRAVIELGATTDTHDAGGRILSRGDPAGIDEPKLSAALAPFRGEISQTPPMFSALKHRGQPLYRLARAGITVARRSRTVSVYRLEAIAFQPPEVTLECECSQGTYIRSLAHDLGQALGCGAFLKTLVRTRYGPFAIEDSADLPRLEEACRDGSWQGLVYPPDYVLGGFPAVSVDEAAALALLQGNTLATEAVGIPDAPSGTLYRAYAPGGRFLGVIRYDPDKSGWRSEKLFARDAG